MTRIDKIHIKEFRGIREQSLELKGQNFATCKPNGPGKGGIEGAIALALTCNLSRLAGRGGSSI